MVVDTPDYSPKQPPLQRPKAVNSEPQRDTPELMAVDGTDDDYMMVDHLTTDMEVEENQHPIVHPLQHEGNTAPQMQGPTHDYLESS